MNKPTKPFRKARKPLSERELRELLDKKDGWDLLHKFGFFVLGLQVALIIYIAVR